LLLSVEPDEDNAEAHSRWLAFIDKHRGTSFQRMRPIVKEFKENTEKVPVPPPAPMHHPTEGQGSESQRSIAPGSDEEVPFDPKDAVPSVPAQTRYDPLMQEMQSISYEIDTPFDASIVQVNANTFRMTLFNAWKRKYCYEGGIERFMEECFDEFFALRGVTLQYVEATNAMLTD